MFVFKMWNILFIELLHPEWISNSQNILVTLTKSVKEQNCSLFLRLLDKKTVKNKYFTSFTKMSK